MSRLNLLHRNDNYEKWKTEKTKKVKKKTDLLRSMVAHSDHLHLIQHSNYPQFISELGKLLR